MRTKSPCLVVGLVTEALALPLFIGIDLSPALCKGFVQDISSDRDSDIDGIQDLDDHVHHHDSAQSARRVATAAVMMRIKPLSSGVLAMYHQPAAHTAMMMLI